MSALIRPEGGGGDGVYIELFLLDNLLMDLLILRLAAAMLSVKPRWKRTFPAALIGSAAAALAAGGAVFMLSLPFKLLSVMLAALALPFRRLRGYLRAVLAVFVSSVTVGGAALLAALLTGGTVKGGALIAPLPLRSVLIGAAAAAYLPRIINRMLLSRSGREHTAALEAELRGGLRIECAALVDTGCTLFDPVTALPVVLVSRKRYPRAAELAHIPIPVRTVAGGCVVYALRPAQLLVNGAPVAALVAFTDTETALIPPALLSPAASHNNNERNNRRQICSG